MGADTVFQTHNVTRNEWAKRDPRPVNSVRILWSAGQCHGHVPDEIRVKVQHQAPCHASVERSLVVLCKCLSTSSPSSIYVDLGETRAKFQHGGRGR